MTIRGADHEERARYRENGKLPEKGVDGGEKGR
jgi:hypothetical protein